jgi:RHS repeat-associated protein
MMHLIFDGKLLQTYNVYGVLLKDYIYMGDRLIAEYDHVGSRYLFYTPDQINSTRVVTDDAGTVVYSAAHDPYGGIQQTWVNTFDPTPKFSGKERDEESQLDYFGARYYDKAQYRFISVDPIISSDLASDNLQRWNLYAYCMNNPLSYFDPDGMEALTAIQRAALETTALKMVENKTPYPSKTEDGGANSTFEHADCNGAVYLVYKTNEFPYINQATTTFAQSTEPGGANSGIILKLENQSNPQLMDIGLQKGHMVMFAEKRIGADGKEEIWVYSARCIGRAYSLCPLWFFDAKGPVTWYTYEVKVENKK